MKRRRRPSVEMLEGRVCLAAPPVYPGAPIVLPVTGPDTSSSFRASPIAADLDGNGKDEFLVSIAGGKLIAYTTDALGNIQVFQTYDTGAANTTHANIKATPVVLFDPYIGHNAVFAALGRDESNPGSVEDGRVFGWDALTGQVLPGWPQTTGQTAVVSNQSGVTGPIASGDLDGDGIPEIVVTSFSHFANAYRLNGSVLWRYNNDDTVEAGAAIGDLDGDGKPEVVIDSSVGPSAFFPAGGALTILDGATGTVKYRTGILSSDPAQRIPEEFFAAPLLIDLNADGKLEIVVGPGPHFNDPSIPGYSPAAQAAGDRVYAFDYQGRILPGWPYHTTSDDTQDRQTYVADSAADLLGNGTLQVIHEDRAGFLHVIQANGQALPGWEQPKQVADPSLVFNASSNAFFTPIVADVDGDGKADIVAARGPYISAFDRFGNLLWRTTTVILPGRLFPDSIYGSAAVGQFNGTGGLELAFASTAGGAPSIPAHLNILQLPASTLAPPWPMHRRTAAGVSAENSLIYDANYTVAIYNALLGRSPTGAELGAVATGLQANRFTPNQIASLLASSAEARGHVVDVYYQRYLGRAPQAQERANLASALGSIRDRDLAQFLATLPEFVQKAGSVNGLIQRLYQAALGRPASATDVSNAIAALSRGTSYSTFVAGILASDEAAARDAAPIFAAVTGGATPAADSLAVLAADLRFGRREESAYAAVLASGGRYASTNVLASWIRTVYRDTLGRDASPSELASIYGLLSGGTITPTALVQFLLNSDEGRTQFLREAYGRILGRVPAAGEISASKNYARREDVLVGLVSSDEFFRNSGSTLAGYIQGAYTAIQYSGTLDSGSLNFWLNRLNTPGHPRSELAQQLIKDENPAELIFHFLPDESQGVLRTGNTAGPAQVNPDPATVAAFTNALAAGARDEDLIAALLTSPQYFQRAAYDKGYYRSRGVRN